MIFLNKFRVGGVPEVLPPHLIKLCEPNPKDLIEKIIEAMPLVKTSDPYKIHEEVRGMYTWDDVAERTEKVYDRITRMENGLLIDRLKKYKYMHFKNLISRYYGCGTWAGKLFCMIVAFDFLLWLLLDWFWPKADIEIAPDFPYEKFIQMKQSKRRLK